MNILIFNCGSSSQCARLYQVNNNQAEPLTIANFLATAVESPSSAGPKLTWHVNEKNGVNKASSITHKQVAKKVIQILQENKIKVDAVGHRFVHGGDLFTKTTLIDTGTLADLRACFPLAPTHNPNAFGVIEMCHAYLPDAPQYAVFDTAFHASMSEEARTYALPSELAEKNGYHKYGFHGISCQYVSAKAAELLEKPLDQVKLIICHLGTGGSSVTAFSEGRTLDTSMGYSPLAGLVMSTRCGDIDPGILIDMMRKGNSADEIEKILNTQSGLIGLSGYSSNLAEVIEKAGGGDKNCLTAYEVYVMRLRHYLGAFSWLLNGADAIVFTDEIGVTSWRLREAVCTDAESLGVILDRSANRKAEPNAVTWIHDDESAVKLLVMQTDEERVILDEVLKQK
ncbi:MAG TPA: acetate kinase [Anaerolineaceae bacterium]|nr:acetate kinase [Anaerolineaceae bacterium]